MNDFNDKVVLVTVGGTGIGQATVNAVRNHGTKVREAISYCPRWGSGCSLVS